MTTDNKTLADVQPGGRVRLGDQAERARFEAWAEGASLNIARFNDGGYCDERTVSAWLAWLSAQPSPGGQDALLGYVRVEAIKALREDDEVTGVMVHVEERTNSLPVYLAARQPVSETDAYQQGFRDGQDRTCTVAASQPDTAHAAYQTGKAIGRREAELEAAARQPVGEAVELARAKVKIAALELQLATYEAPAQAVDLERFRGTVKSQYSMTEWMHRCGFVSAEKLEESKKNHDHLMALIDSQAVGNG